MPTKNVILTENGLNQSLEEFDRRFHRNYDELLAAIQKYVGDHYSSSKVRCPSDRTAMRYFQEHPEKEKGLSLKNFNLIRCTLFDIEPDEVDQVPWTDVAMRVADIQYDASYSIQLKRGSDRGLSEDVCSEKSSSINDDEIPNELPSLDVVPIGRDRELAAIVTVLKRDGRALITGMPGIGKSLLALHYAGQQKQAYSGGVFWIDAREGSIGLQLVEMAILQGVETPDSMTDSTMQLRYCLRRWPRSPQPVLLVVDNAEEADNISNTLQWLVPDRFKVLLTARPQLQLISIERIELVPLSIEEALSIFKTSLPKGDRRLDEEYEELAILCENVLGGLPLAIQIVAQALKDNPYLGVKEFNNRLQNVSRNPFDDSGLINVDTAGMVESVRHGLMAVFELSWQALPADAQLLASLFSLFAPVQVPWVLIAEAAQDVAGLHNPAVACSKLIHMNLLRRTGKQLYQLHQLLRGFFQLKAKAFGDVEQQKQQALLDVCRRLPENCNQTDAARFAAVEPHVAAAIAEGHHEPELFIFLQYYFVGHGLYQQAYEWSQQALAEYEDRECIDLEQRALLYKLAGERSHLSGNFNDAIQYLEMAIKILPVEFPSALLAKSLVTLAASQRESGQLKLALGTSAEALDMCSTVFGPNSLGLADALLTDATNQMDSLIHYPSSQTDTAFEELETSIQLVLSIRQQYKEESKTSVAEACNLLADLYELWDKQEKAISLYRKAVELTQPPHVDAASARNNLAKAIESCAQPSEVIGLYKEAINIFADAQMLGRQGWSMKNLGVYYANQGMEKEGLALVEQGCTLLNQVAHPRYSVCKDTLNTMRKRIT